MNYEILTKLTNEQANQMESNGDWDAMHKLYEQMAEFLSYYSQDFIAVEIYEDGTQKDLPQYYNGLDDLTNGYYAKNGFDLVKYEDGKIGLVGYDNYSKTYIKILREATAKEIDERQSMEELSKTWEENFDDIKHNIKHVLSVIEDYARDLDNIEYNINELAKTMDFDTLENLEIENRLERGDLDMLLCIAKEINNGLFDIVNGYDL